MSPFPPRDKYSFYNPKQHPFFDQDGGRTIYFEGTYATTFSGNPQPTPRYDYNQVMYRLDLSAPALNLPVAFYETQDSADRSPFAAAQTQGRVAFFANERPGPDTVPVAWDGTSLKAGALADPTAALFHALPLDAKPTAAATTPLYEFVHEKTGVCVYSTAFEPVPPGSRRSAEPVCRVWKMPIRNRVW